MANPLPKRTHPKGPCRNPECYRPRCEGYRLGFEEGQAQGREEGREAAEAEAG
jgi:hypothetical protein